MPLHPCPAPSARIPAARPLTTALLSAALVLLGTALVAPPAFAADPAAVTGVTAKGDATTTEVRINLGASGSPSYSVFRLSSPERLVVDLSGAVAASPALTSGGLVSRVETSTFGNASDNLRITLFLSSAVKHDVALDGSDLVLKLTAGKVDDPLSEGAVKLSGPQGVQGPSLTTLDFQQREKSSRILIGVTGTEAAVSQPSKETIAVDLPGATIPEAMRRELDTRFFASAVDSVRATTTRSGVRVTIQLRTATEYEITREAGMVFIDIATPAEILAQRDRELKRAAAAAPSTPSTNGTGAGLSNAAGSEVMIGGDGKTSDPQALFGSGGGSRAPGTYGFVTDGQSVMTGRYTGSRISIDLQDADIHTVFRFIADFASINIVTSDDVSGKVTVRLQNVPWDEALAAVLQSKGLGAQQIGNIVRVAPLDKIKAEQQSQLDTKKFEEQLEDLSVLIAPLNYAQADELLEQVKSVLSERGSVQVDERTNKLVIRDGEDVIAKVRELLKQLDTPNRQVSIEARFVEASSSYTRSLGIQWGGEVDASATTGYPTGSFFPSSVGVSGGTDTTGSATFFTTTQDSLLVNVPANGTAGSLALNLGSIPGLVDINARLSAIQSEGYGKIVSSPRLTVLDNETAVVTQGARIPFETVSQTGTQVQFITAALELEVTPHITAEGTVFLEIDIANDRPDFSQTVQGRPTIQTKELQTRVLVEDGDTTVLGGVYATSDTESVTSVPFFGKIPILGALFRNRLNSRTQNEMLVFITPHVVPLEAEE